MANKKFSQLTSAVSLTDTDIIPIVDGTGTKKIAASAVKTYATSGLATVATSGSYNDLTDKPAIPTDVNELSDASGLLTATAEPKFDIKSTAFAASSNTRYGVDTTIGAITAVLPASPGLGDAVFFADAGGAFVTNNLTIDRNGNTINGAAADVTVNVNGDSVGLFWNGTTWRLYE